MSISEAEARYDPSSDTDADYPHEHDMDSSQGDEHELVRGDLSEDITGVIDMPSLFTTPLDLFSSEAGARSAFPDDEGSSSKQQQYNRPPIFSRGSSVLQTRATDSIVPTSAITATGNTEPLWLAQELDHTGIVRINAEPAQPRELETNRSEVTDAENIYKYITSRISEGAGVVDLPRDGDAKKKSIEKWGHYGGLRGKMVEALGDAAGPDIRKAEAAIRETERKIAGSLEMALAIKEWESDVIKWNQDKLEMEKAVRISLEAVLKAREEKEQLEENNSELKKEIQEASKDTADRIRELKDCKMENKQLESSVRKLKAEIIENKRVQRMGDDVGDDGEQRPPQPMALKFTFKTTSRSVQTIGTMEEASNLYSLFNQSSRWSDIVSKRNSVGFQWGEYNVHRDHRGKYPGVRSTHNVRFEPAFNDEPVVVVWLTGVLMARDRVWSVRAFANAVTKFGFQVVVESLGDSVLHAAGVAWVAYSDHASGIYSGIFETMDDGWKCAISESKGKAQLNPKCKDKPRVLIAVQEIVVEVGEGLEMTLDVDGEREELGWEVAVTGTEGKVFSVNGVWVALDWDLMRASWK